jgi:glycine dehydrogenase
MTDSLSTLLHNQSSQFLKRHIGPDSLEMESMLKELGIDSIDDLINATIPAHIRKKTDFKVPSPLSEIQALDLLKDYAEHNTVNTCYLGTGYYPCHTPSVIQRNVLENPGWYTAYTPYQPEISQGRLEALLNYQQMIIDLTAMDLANASLLDEATAAAEAMAMSKRCNKKNKSNTLFIDINTYPQTIAVVTTRAHHMGIDVHIGDYEELSSATYFAAIIQYPGNDGFIPDLESLIAKIHKQNALSLVACDLLSLSLIKPPGECGADIVFGNSQRFGVPMGCGGPHAAFFATKEKFKRSVPGRIIGQSIDAHQKPALRMALQTREQHIRREKATSNICTSQSLLAIMSGFYAVFHGESGIRSIAERVNQLTALVAKTLVDNGLTLVYRNYFDTLMIKTASADAVLKQAYDNGINLRKYDDTHILLSLNETTTLDDVTVLLSVICQKSISKETLDIEAVTQTILDVNQRTSKCLSHPIFGRYTSETSLLRYIHSLERKDIALNYSMIALGSCTMKLNPTSAMLPITWQNFSNLHPYAPSDQLQGYAQLCSDLESYLAECTGYDSVSLQPNAGSQGEYAGLLAIKRYHNSLGQGHRNICLIPSSAHGTNPASAQMVNYKIVIISCDDNGNVDLDDLKVKIDLHKENLAALMVTYPSTHGVFEESISQICDMVHDAQGQVYLDGANLNAMVGLAEPGKFGADVSHLNLHKTFAIPHGGGGPGMGPIGVKSHLTPFLPQHPLEHNIETGDVVSAAPWGSAGILPISWMYIRMLGDRGLRLATQLAILNANYIADRLKNSYSVLYRGKQGRVAHECIIDLRSLKEISGVSEEDIAKRLIDYGFHAPTMSFPVAGTLMIEPTESENLQELDRFCDAMIAIKKEIDEITSGVLPRDNNPLINAPHSHEDLNKWDRPYSLERAFFPTDDIKNNKYWPPVNRIDNVYGDRNFCCSLSEY